MANDPSNIAPRAARRRCRGGERVVSRPAPGRGTAARAADSDNLERGWRASSSDLRQGLDVIELPASLAPDVLAPLFNAPR
jgi:hypothetical protein